MQEKIDSAITYAIGGGAIAVPFVQHYLELATTLVGFLTALGGLVLVVWRLQHEHKKRGRK